MEILSKPFLRGRRAFITRSPLLLLSASALAGCYRSAEPTHVFQLEHHLPAADARIAKFRRAFDQLPTGAVKLTTLRIDINSDAAVIRAMDDILDAPTSICLAGSGAMAGVAAQSLKRAVVLFATQNDPVEAGLVKTLEAPGLNRTGFTFYSDTLTAVVANLRSLKPQLARVAVVADSFVKPEARISVAKFNALNMGVQCVLLVADNDAELAACFQQSVKDGIQAWVMKETAMVQKHHEMISAHLAKSGILSVYDFQSVVEKGGLMAYTASFFDPYAVWVRQISLLLSGVPASVIPVETPQVFKLYLNLDTAQRTGVDVPKALIKSAERTFYSGAIK